MSTDSTIAVVANLASKPFDGAEEGLDAVLGAVQQILGYQTVLLSQIDSEQSLLRIHAVRNTDSALTVPLGLQIPLTASPCQHVASSAQPFSSSDMRADPGLAPLPAAKDMGATAYLGVPVVLADGSFFGTLVGLDTRPQEQTDEQTQWLQILAGLAAGQIQRQSVEQLVA